MQYMRRDSDSDSDCVNDDDSMFLGFIDTYVNTFGSEWTECIELRPKTRLLLDFN